MMLTRVLMLIAVLTLSLWILISSEQRTAYADNELIAPSHIVQTTFESTEQVSSCKELSELRKVGFKQNQDNVGV